SPLALHYDLIMKQHSESELEAIVHNLATIQRGIECLNTRELAILERGFVESFIALEQQLDAAGKHAFARLLWDYSLPIALLIYDAIKYFQFPKSVWVLRYPAQSANRMPSDWLNVIPFAVTRAHEQYCRQQKQRLTLDRLGVWLHDPFNGGAMNRVWLL